MLVLSIVWIVVGALTGALASGARLGLRARGFAGWGATAGTLGLGAIGGLFFGWLGVWLFGRPFGMPMAFWGAVLVAVAAPWALRTLRSRAASIGG